MPKMNVSLRSLWSQEQVGLLLLGIAVGVLGGYGAVLLVKMIEWFRVLSYGSTGNFLDVLASHPWWYKLLAPMAGGLVVGPMIYFFAQEAKGHGVPEVMEAVSLRGGVIRKRVAVIKSVASAISIAVGGAVGREGPIIQIGSGIGSSVAQVLKLSPARMRILVGCGAAAGIAAAFNAPLAGAMFALEIILGEFAISSFSPIVMSSVMATAISRHYLGDKPAFAVPMYHLASGYELVLYLLLGAAAAVVAVGFTTFLYKVEDIFDDWKFPGYLKAAAGGLLLGAIGLLAPWVMGVGYEGIELAMGEKLVWWLLLAIMAMKILASSVSLASGMSGGIFAPSLFMGAMLGGAFGHFAHYLFPHFTAGPGAYAIVGMAALVAGTTHGPLSAFLILFEMTGTYNIILPLMIACVVATLVARQIRPESIYTLKLLRRGVDIEGGKEMNTLRSLTVSEAMRRDVVSVPNGMKLGDFFDTVVRSKFSSFPVVNERDELVGVVGHADYAEHAFDKDLWDVVVVQDLATRNVVYTTPTETLAGALRKISTRDFATLPVVAGEQDHRLVGIISHRDIISVYSRQLQKSSINA